MAPSDHFGCVTQAPPPHFTIPVLRVTFATGWETRASILQNAFSFVIWLAVAVCGGAATTNSGSSEAWWQGAIGVGEPSAPWESLEPTLSVLHLKTTRWEFVRVLWGQELPSCPGL